MKLDEHRGNSSKYLRAQLWVNGRKKNMRVHRMVAECYVDNAENKPHVHHKDGDTFNNNAENLEWVTPAENNAYRGG